MARLAADVTSLLTCRLAGEDGIEPMGEVLAEHFGEDLDPATTPGLGLCLALLAELGNATKHLCEAVGMSEEEYLQGLGIAVARAASRGGAPEA